MSRRAATVVKAVCTAGALLLPASLTAQRAGPWIPIGSRLDRAVSWTIDDGGLAGVDPLTRPYRMAAVRAAVAAQDTADLSPAGRRAFVRLRAALEGASDSTAVVLEAGMGAYRDARRDAFRPGGGAGVGPAGGVWVGATRGPFVVVVNPGFDNRLKKDPEFTGNIERFIAGRLQTSYVAVTGMRGDLLLGRAARNWGPQLFDGLQLSPSAYATDLAAGALRLGRFELTTIAQRLDDDDTSAAVPINRYFLAHRLGMRAGRRTWVALTETGVYGGAGRGFEPAFIVPLGSGILAEVNEGKRVNLLLGAEAYAAIGARSSIAAQLVVDDIQVDRVLLTDRRPWSGGFTVVAATALPRSPVHLTLGYTLVRSLTYRNANDGWATYALRGVGLARNFADYDQLLGRAAYRAPAGWDVAVEGSWIRQGNGDFRHPFPPDSILAGPGQGFLVAPVRRMGAARIVAEAEPAPGLLLNGTIGVSGNGAGGTRTIASLSARLRFDAVRRRFGSAWQALEP